METRRKKVLYLMSIPWGWIKQRPHFLSEGLVKYFDVDVFFKRPSKINKENLLTSLPDDTTIFRIRSFRLIPFHAIPILKRLRLDFINRWLLKIQLPSLKSYDYIWIPTPRLYSTISCLLLPTHKVVYDCMDDMAEIGNNSADYYERGKFLEFEKQLLQRADYVIFSASYLRDKVLSRAGMVGKSCIVVNNAIELPKNEEVELLNDVEEKLGLMKGLSKTLLYVGTIAKWFDFATMLKVLCRDEDMHLVLIGPLSNVILPSHPRIVYLGTMKRDYIFPFMQQAHVLVMPFVVNELIKSVNPVKLYEYIYTGKPVLAPRYQEAEAFSEFVELYDDAEGFMKAIEKAISVKRDSGYLARCHEFLNRNTWECRCKAIVKYLQA